MVGHPYYCFCLSLKNLLLISPALFPLFFKMCFCGPAKAYKLFFFAKRRAAPGHVCFTGKAFNILINIKFAGLAAIIGHWQIKSLRVLFILYFYFIHYASRPNNLVINFLKLPVPFFCSTIFIFNLSAII